MTQYRPFFVPLVRKADHMVPVLSSLDVLAATLPMDRLLLAAHSNITWYAVPLAAAISLVYSASRYELPERVVRRAARLTVTILGFMAGVLILLWLLSRSL